VILAVETATSACSVALCDVDGRVLAEVVALEGPAHTQRLLPGVHAVLAQAGAEWAGIDVVAAGLGPGAFTGLRIGIATARALAQADGHVLLAGVPTTAALALALAEAAPSAATLVPLVDGKRREVFAAVYGGDEGHGVRVIEEVRVLPLAEVSGWLAGLDRPVVGGDGVALLDGDLPAGVIDAGVPAPTAAMVGLAVARRVPGLVTGPDAVLPVYGRAPDAARWTGPAASGGGAAAQGTPAPAAPTSAAPAASVPPFSSPEVRR
jgi:tRNA threonylcarbamoyladenosine biosynthesis protein TsaB